MQLNYQDTMSDFMASFSYINQYHLYKQESDTTEDFLSASTMYEYPDPQVDTKLQLNENTLVSIYTTLFICLYFRSVCQRYKQLKMLFVCICLFDSHL